LLNLFLRESLGEGSPFPKCDSDLKCSLSCLPVCQALLSLRQETWDALAKQVFGTDGATLDVSAVMAKIAETNTCRNLDPPVEVFIDADGDFSVLVYDVTEPV
jgi:hypothetical protein